MLDPVQAGSIDRADPGAGGSMRKRGVVAGAGYAGEHSFDEGFAVAPQDRCNVLVGGRDAPERSMRVGLLLDALKVAFEPLFELLGRPQRRVRFDGVEALDGVFDRGDVVAALAGEVVVEQPARDAAGGGYVLDGDLLPGASRKKSDAGVEHLLAADVERHARSGTRHLSGSLGATACVPAHCYTSVQ